MAAWDLSVVVEELGDDKPISISVTSELHIGGVILKLVEKTRKSHTHTHTLSQIPVKKVRVHVLDPRVVTMHSGGHFVSDSFRFLPSCRGKA